MAPSLLSLGTAALACAGSAVATKWQLSETYDASNFFDKFDFITVRRPPLHGRPLRRLAQD